MALGPIEISSLLSDLRMARAHMHHVAGDAHADAAIVRIDAAIKRMSAERDIGLAIVSRRSLAAIQQGLEPTAPPVEMH
jgi:hypothetical protein